MSAGGGGVAGNPVRTGGEGLPHDAAPANPVYLAALTSLPLSSFMELVRGLHNLRSRHRGCVATIGNYDGVHAGHQAILKRLDRKSTRLNSSHVRISYAVFC